MIMAGIARSAVKIARPLQRIPSLRRYQSNPPSPSPKIRAIPFRLTPSKASKRLHEVSLHATRTNSSTLLIVLEKWFGPLVGGLARYFGLGGQGLKMRSMKAVYWPIWRMDILLDGKLGIREKGGMSQAQIVMNEAYLPGNAFAPLSYLSFGHQSIPDDIPLYDVADLSQLGRGYDIAAVPFKVSPFAVMAKIREMIGKKGKADTITSVDESHWKEVMMAAYPIYFPIYVAEFEQELHHGKRRFNLILDANERKMKDNRVSWSPPPDVFTRSKNNYYVNPYPFAPDARIVLPRFINRRIEHDLSPGLLNQLFTNWLSPTPSSARSIPNSPLLDIDVQIKWEDPRIQDWSGSQMVQNKEYMERAKRFWVMKGSTDAMGTFSHQLTKREKGYYGEYDDDFDSKDKDDEEMLKRGKPVTEVITEFGKKMGKEREDMISAKPDWLVSWDAERGSGKVKILRKGDGVNKCLVTGRVLPSSVYL